ncbi:AraC family transcriptional regulator [Marinomonas piezotolerans]|uniref:AraC family transcriptional regulator n=1 Tax=Marinomonas piezotolerans TaxID=2213058 RepID=A0A370U7L0_9GAMM|nr:effector binding domain-containing protein [Marinomonas piezotolerans]RDL43779.1 AraC family transcriptional regulator [Marinomonas piezotolerans]
MTPQSFPKTPVYGVCVRTTNQQEMSPEGGHIARLWQQFNQDIAPLLKEGNQVFGVYCHFEGDETGEFDVIAGTDQADFADISTMAKVVLDAEKYLVFDVAGALPMGIIDAWQKIWHYFAQPDCPFQRAFETDFEHYLSQQKALIYISVR